ncbi:MAG: nuclear transport factor 2 family protein [Solirubrobacteraceae bacterium]
MSEESTTPDLVLWRSAIEAGNTRDIQAIMRFFAPDSVWDNSSVGLGIVEARAAIRSLFEDWWGGYEEYGQEAEEICDLGNGVIFGILVMRGRLPGSTGWVSQRYAAVATLADGLIDRTTNFFDIDEAHAAAERLAKERG